ncbi:MAG: hypothetical protein WC331_10505 [Candidatus Omnitrophota bacterium]|jgi:ABC-type glycerol-3-phosphate transport system substrate-binding protein
MKRKFAVLALLAMVLMLAACAAGQFRTNSYKTLAGSATIYESGYPAFLDLYNKGIISFETKEKGRALAIKYWAAYHAAANALIAYDAVDSAENKDRVTIAIFEAQKFLTELTAYIQPFLVREVK